MNETTAARTEQEIRESKEQMLDRFDDVKEAMGKLDSKLMSEFDDNKNIQEMFEALREALSELQTEAMISMNEKIEEAE